MVICMPACHVVPVRFQAIPPEYHYQETFQSVKAHSEDDEDDHFS